MNDQVTLRISMEQSDADLEEKAVGIAIKERTPLQPDDPLASGKFVEPVSLIGILTPSYLASRLVNHWLKSEEQGALIDTREKPPLVSRIAGVPAGYLVIIDAEGKATHHKGDYDKPEELMPLLEKALGGAALLGG